MRTARTADQSAIDEVSRSGTQTLRETYRPKDQTTAATQQGTMSPRTQLVASINDKVVGCAKYYREADCLHILGLMVHSSARRRGVACALVEHISRAAQLDGATRLSLFTIRQTGNVAIFEKLGFRTISESADTFAESVTGEALTEVYMERRVSL